MTKSRDLADSVNPDSIDGDRLVSESVNGDRLVSESVGDDKIDGTNPISSLKVSYLQNGVGADPRPLESRLRDFVSVKDFGAVGNQQVDDTEAIQAAFDSPGNSPVYFPSGIYKVSGNGAACLTLKKNRNIIGSSRGSTIQSFFAGPDTAVLDISITDNGGFLDVRNFYMGNLFLSHFSGGRDGLIIGAQSPNLGMTTSTIENCLFGPGTNPLGYGLKTIKSMSHSRIVNCTIIGGAYLEDWGDANVITKCLSYGEKPGYTITCDGGVRNNSILDNTIVNRDGAVRIINGDNVRIENNQIELAQGYVPPTSQSPVSAMIWIEGVDRPVPNTVIRANNFGGGTNLDTLIYIDNGYRTVIRENYLQASAQQDVYLTANAKYVILGACNTTQGNPIDPRPRTLLKTKVVDLGVGNMGILQPASKLGAQNGWTVSDFYKDEYGVVRFLSDFTGGTAVPSTIIGTLPEGFRPQQLTRIPATTQSGIGQISIDSSGVITVDSLPSGSGVRLSEFQSGATEEA